MALSLRREKFTVSVRQLGEEAKVAKETAGRSLHRLVDKNLLTKTKPFVRNTPAEYQLVMPDMTITAPNESPNAYIHVSGGCVETVSVERLHDVFRWGSGLGHTAGEVWRNLRTDEPITAVELTDIVDVHKSTTHRCLRKLREVGMAARTRDGWVRVERDLDEVAVELGVDGKTDQQRWVHELERDNWERYLAMPGPKVPSPDIVIRTKLWGRAAQAQTGRQNVATAPRATRAAEG
jgi:predicted transcriptional regulator